MNISGVGEQPGNGVHRAPHWQILSGGVLFALGWMVSQSTTMGMVDATLKGQASEMAELKQVMAGAIQDQTKTNIAVAEALSELKTEVAALKDRRFYGHRGDRRD